MNNNIITIIVSALLLAVAGSAAHAQGLGGRERDSETKRQGVNLQIPFPHRHQLESEQESQLVEYYSAADLANRCAEATVMHIGCEDTGWLLAVAAKKLGSKLTKTFPKKKQRTPEQREQFAWIRARQTELVTVEQRAMLVRGNTGRGL